LSGNLNLEAFSNKNEDLYERAKIEKKETRVDPKIKLTCFITCGVPPIKQSKHSLTPKFLNFKNRLPILD
jgi:hypothetical protein